MLLMRLEQVAYREEVLMTINYTVLSQDNADQMMALTGMSKEEMKKILTQNDNSGSVQVFWREGSRWFGVRVSAEYVFLGELDRVIQKAIQISKDMHVGGTTPDPHL